MRQEDFNVLFCRVSILLLLLWSAWRYLCSQSERVRKQGSLDAADAWCRRLLPLFCDVRTSAVIAPDGAPDDVVGSP
eukprot:CAMPEP_0170345854 /NCGR_PEP_ID=MMETSP0116_2-20130129/74165_1 /TAXON_ID=400756 /ORGANISM="Durinskia baltica, Strain CSIRO CS-38" /LENGTH=76 /DNA_ID=CAMNT_0010599633 /DNA_START=82 /DNA_END=308 /DNA_ORIENTATION=-